MIRRIPLLFTALCLPVTSLACDNTALVGSELDGGGGAGGSLSPAGGAGSYSPPATGAAGSYAPPPTGAAGAGVPFTTPPSASWLLFDSLRGVNRDLYAVRSDGSGLKRLTTSRATEQQPAASPDGQTLAYASDESGVLQIYLMAVPAGAPTQLTHRSEGAEQPAWSPDGTLLAFHSGLSVFVIAADGTGERELATGLDMYNMDEHPVFAPDGRSVIYDRGNQIHQTNLDTGLETSIIHNWTTIVEQPAVTPDGVNVAYDVECTDFNIWIAPLTADTTPCQGGVRVTAPQNGPARHPAFSPEGLLAFEHGDGKADLSVVLPNGLYTPVVITSGGDDRNPSWAPVSFGLPTSTP